MDLAPFVQNLTLEGLVKVTSDGRVKPWLAKGWTVARDGLTLIVELRPNVRFHDGSPVTTTLVVDTLRAALLETFPVGEDIRSITAVSETQIEIQLKQPSTFVLEGLEVQIRKPDAPSIGTGPYRVVPSVNAAELLADDSYYLGPSTIDRIRIANYPSVRAAWAEMLRNNLDMVYEVGVNALDSLQPASTIDVFSYTRNYQYFVMLNSRVPALRSAAIRRALNAAIDRSAFVDEALDGRGVPSSGPLWPGNWAVAAETASFPHDPSTAAQVVANANTPITFRCLIAPEDELVALVVKRQLAAVGVEMILEQGTVDSNRDALATGHFDAFLASIISGPSVLRTYHWWHSRSPKNNGRFVSTPVDVALDMVRHAIDDDEYRRGVLAFQQAILADPPAIFLAWSERARAVSRRFQVPKTEPNIDILGTLRLWQPASDSVASAN